MNDDPKSRDRNSTQLVWSTDGLIFSRPRSYQPELSSYTTFDNNSRPIGAKLIELTLRSQPDKHMGPNYVSGRRCAISL